MGAPTRPPRNGFVRFMRKIYNPIGFSKGYNALLWFIFDGALFGFILARFVYLNFYGEFCAPNQGGANHAGPGECYWFLSFNRNKIGIQIHLYTIIPAGLLVVLQFVPWIRYNALLYHRIAGYVITLLLLVSHVGVLMVANHSFNGDLATRTAVGFVVIATTVSISLALYNIKKVQIEQHRAWMLRTWSYMGFIVTIRIIQILSGVIIAAWQGDAKQVLPVPCAELLSLYGSVTPLANKYPVCAGDAANSLDVFAVVNAKFGSNDVSEIAAGLAVGFGSAAWLAFALHAIGIELYLHLTPAEAIRLRQVSYERQVERGIRNPGFAGTVVQRLGDAPAWAPQQVLVTKESREDGLFPSGSTNKEAAHPLVVGQAAGYDSAMSDP